jgi:ABC-type branched-subunit amino acid transport system ATPase component
MGFIGPNGAGKSTTIRILMGLVHQDRGEVQVLGHAMPGEQVAAKWDVGSPPKTCVSRLVHGGLAHAVHPLDFPSWIRPTPRSC